jgi:hypothetical protein
MGYSLPLQVTFVVDDLLRGERGRRIMGDSKVKGFLLDRIVNIAKEKQPEMVGSVLSLTDDWIPSAIVGTTDLKREVASYGVVARPRSYLHNSLSEYMENIKMPDWYFDKQDEGDLFELMDIVDFTELLIQETMRDQGEK